MLNSVIVKNEYPEAAEEINVSKTKIKVPLKPNVQLMKHATRSANNKERLAELFNTSLVKNLEEATGTSL